MRYGASHEGDAPALSLSPDKQDGDGRGAERRPHKSHEEVRGSARPSVNDKRERGLGCAGLVRN